MKRYNSKFKRACIPFEPQLYVFCYANITVFNCNLYLVYNQISLSNKQAIIGFCKSVLINSQNKDVLHKKA